MGSRTVRVAGSQLTHGMEKVMQLQKWGQGSRGRFGGMHEMSTLDGEDHGKFFFLVPVPSLISFTIVSP